MYTAVSDGFKKLHIASSICKKNFVVRVPVYTIANVFYCDL